MALVNFKKGTSTDYQSNLASYAEYIYVCTDTRDVYMFGVLQQGIPDEVFTKLSSFDNSVLSVINAQKGINGGLVGLNEQGQINSQYLPSFVDDVVDVYATYEPDEVGNLTNIQLFKDSAHETPITGESGKIYQNIATGEPAYQFRWTGTVFAPTGANVLIIGEVEGTAFDGARGKAVEDAANALPTNVVTSVSDVTAGADSVSFNFNGSTKNGDTNQYSDAGQVKAISIAAASGTAAGVMSAADKKKLDQLTEGLEEGTPSLKDLNDTVEGIVTDMGSKGNLNTTSKDNLVNAINEVNNNAVKKVKCGTSGAEIFPANGSITIPVATAAADGVMASADKAKLDKVITNGDGASFLANDGTYKAISMVLPEDYAMSEEVNEALAPEAGDDFATVVGKFHKAFLDNEEVIAKAFVNLQTVLGVENPNQTLPDMSSTNYLANKNTVVACLTALDTALKTVADQAATISDLTSRVTALEQALTLKNA